MYVIIWEYRVKVERVAEFEEIYSATGAWTQLFQRSKAYLATELVVDQSDSLRYLTMDRWRSSHDYQLFLAEWKNEYDHLDARCEGLAERETLLGKWGAVLTETQ